ncbi:MAG: signal peptidase II [Chloroflexi bacterium]|nr:signal peptidase II [Chloroflexota bacterium]
MEKGTKAAWTILTTGLCVVLDQATKALARQHLRGSPPIYVLGGLVELQYGENAGAFLGFGAKLPEEVRFIALVWLMGLALITGLVGLILMRRLPIPVVVAASLILGGGIGNLIDRIRHGGAVIDFVAIGWGRIGTGVFNLADVAVMAGLAMITYELLFAEGTSAAERGSVPAGEASAREEAEQRARSIEGKGKAP